MEPEKKGKEFEFEKKRWRHQLFSNLLLISTIILYGVVLLGNPGASAEINNKRRHSLYVLVRNWMVRKPDTSGSEKKDGGSRDFQQRLCHEAPKRVHGSETPLLTGRKEESRESINSRELHEPLVKTGTCQPLRKEAICGMLLRRPTSATL
jgi:hypothetical protein